SAPSPPTRPPSRSPPPRCSRCAPPPSAPARATSRRCGPGKRRPWRAPARPARSPARSSPARRRASPAARQPRPMAPPPTSAAPPRLEAQLLAPARRAAPDRLADLLADDYVEHGASGRTYDKAQALAALAPITAPVVSDFRARPLGRDRALVTYRIIKDGARSLRSSIWERTAAGRWQLVVPH